MTDTTRLKQVIEGRGLKLGYIAGRLGITRQALSAKIAGVTEFKASEIVAMRSILGLTPREVDEIFLTEKMNLLHPGVVHSDR